jgi:hypothetical protein
MVRFTCNLILTDIWVKFSFLEAIPKMIRFFNRTFLLVRVGSAFIVINDIMFVTLPTKDQLKVFISSFLFSCHYDYGFRFTGSGIDTTTNERSPHPKYLASLWHEFRMVRWTTLPTLI